MSSERSVVRNFLVLIPSEVAARLIVFGEVVYGLVLILPVGLRFSRGQLTVLNI
jgi:hypothetical protein